MRGFTQQLRISPRDQRLPSSPITVIVAAGATRIINFFNEFLGMASSVFILNRDAVNTIQIIINNDRANAFTLPANASYTISDQWVEQIEIVAGAAAVTVVNAQMVLGKDIGLSVI